ncbi:response regulator transcription factor [Paenibacillus sp. SYP-B4298]|uniref:response regulator transcription factor n=1 Tax=Paenibacillus sp. SYP-B4298 TaxID=2996034 RepID=UPI0022DE94A9|nr:response regulator [Paenibacillus sp. SYP-B4298]
MLKVLLVDDDLPMLSKLKNMVDWEHLGCQLCGEANGGQAAVTLLHKCKPEIVITDMSMPGMDGLALINYMEAYFPHTQVIAISSFSDVHFVKNSMRKGAVDYILKHELDVQVLQAALTTAKELLAKGQEAQEQTLNIQKHIQQSHTTLLRNFIRELVENGFGSEKELVQNADKLDITLNLRMLTVVVAEWDSRGKLADRYDAKELAVMKGSFMDIVDNILTDTGNAFMTPIENGKFAFLFSLETNSRFMWHTMISEALSRIRVSVKRQLNFTISCSVSEICSKPDHLPSYFQTADKELQQRFYEGGDVVIWPGIQRREANSISFSVDVKLERLLLSHLATLNETELIRQVEELFIRMGQARAPHKTTQMVAVELIHLVNRKSKEAGISEQELFGDDQNPYQIIGQFDTLVEMKEWIIEIYRKLIQALRPSLHDNHYSDNIRRTLEWIRQHFAEPITLQEVADVVGVNASYLSRLFKEECKQGFTDYVNHVRVEYAKLLIRSGETDLKNVVKQAGFNHYNYFFTVFKKTTGMTPLAYEKQQKR